MRFIKTLGFAMVAAAVLTAFIGASTSSATVLCKTTQQVCGAGWDYSAGSSVNSSMNNTSLFKAGIEDTCTKGVLSGPEAATGSSTETVRIEILELYFENCTCPMTVITKGSLEIHYVGEGRGTMTGKNSRITVNCAGVSCAYGTAAGGTDLGALDEPVTSSSDARITISASLPKMEGGFLCAGVETWTGEYIVTSPTPLYVATKAEGQP
jgi:hypothetical protein